MGVLGGESHFSMSLTPRMFVGLMGNIRMRQLFREESVIRPKQQNALLKAIGEGNLEGVDRIRHEEVELTSKELKQILEEIDLIQLDLYREVEGAMKDTLSDLSRKDISIDIREVVASAIATGAKTIEDQIDEARKLWQNLETTRMQIKNARIGTEHTFIAFADDDRRAFRTDVKLIHLKLRLMLRVKNTTDAKNLAEQLQHLIKHEIRQFFEMNLNLSYTLRDAVANDEKFLGVIEKQLAQGFPKEVVQKYRDQKDRFSTQLVKGEDTLVNRYVLLYRMWRDYESRAREFLDNAKKEMRQAA